MPDLFLNTTIQKIFSSVVVILVCYFISYLMIRVINRSVKDLKRRHQVRKAGIYLISILAIVLILSIWVKRIGSLATFVSVVGAGVTLALHQAILSMAGWFFLLIRRPYEIGDRIEIGEVKGDVIDMRLFFTTLLEIGNWVDADQSTGRIVHIPNGKIFTQPVFNFTRGFEHIWHEIKVVVTYESDWERGKEIMLDAASDKKWDIGDNLMKRISKMSRRYMIHFEKLTPFVWTRIVDFGVELTLRYLTDARKRRSTQDEISRLILDRFSQEPTVDFAYPTYRVFRRGEE
ncbi:mechanosensitive ion channel family protein [Acidobacteriota bacterium]